MIKLDQQKLWKFQHQSLSTEHTVLVRKEKWTINYSASATALWHWTEVKSICKLAIGRKTVFATACLHITEWRLLFRNPKLQLWTPASLISHQQRANSVWMHQRLQVWHHQCKRCTAISNCTRYQQLIVELYVAPKPSHKILSAKSLASATERHN